MKTNRVSKFLVSALALCLAIAFVVKFAGTNILRQYISYGIGECKNIPILCMQPEEKLFSSEINPEYLNTLVPHKFPRMSISAPKGFTLVQELVKKVYYKKRHVNNQAVIYLLRQDPFAFIKLYPNVKKQGIEDNREFMRRLMYANLGKVENMTDAFFVIMKSVFTPDIGNQSTAKMIRFTINGKSGYINYTLTKSGNYFDCNVLDTNDNFFKVYVKDIGAQLDLNKVYGILSTIKPVD